MIVREKSRPSERQSTLPAPERPRGVQPAKLGGTAGVSRDVLRELNAAAKREQPRLTPPPMRPWPALMRDSGGTHAACILADTILDDISDLAEQVVDLLPSLESAFADSHDRMRLTPWVARLAALLDLEETAAVSS